MNSLRPRIGLAGYFGYGNLGDEWFLLGWRDLFAGHAYVRVLHPGDAFDDLDGIIIGGGDLVTPQPNNHYWTESWLEKPTWVYGVGVPTYPKWERAEVVFYQRFLDRCRGVSVRDTGSFAWMHHHDVEADMVEDIAWGAPLPQKFTRPIGSSERKIFGLSIRPHYRYDDERSRAAIVNLCRDLWEEGYETHLLPLQCPAPGSISDYQMHVELQEAINKDAGAISTIEWDDYDVEHRLSLIGHCALYGTMRFHGLIAALRYGVPCAAPIFPGSNKFVRLQEQIGVPLVGTTMLQWTSILARGSHNATTVAERVRQKEAAARAQLEAFRDDVLNHLKGA